MQVSAFMKEIDNCRLKLTPLTPRSLPHLQRFNKVEGSLLIRERIKPHTPALRIGGFDSGISRIVAAAVRLYEGVYLLRVPM